MNKIGALKPSPPAGNSGSALLLPSSRQLLLIVGDFWAFFRISSSMPSAFPQIAAPALLVGFLGS
ncbi:hypothetical protein SLEP1_g3721 [Rubroshorea leprosula]|uniref:Uncharacterized protein n=1 Tax=Rubroshorea leprosula TaxID=152421 RepID=A0AAV5HLU3_9ROSI|nr:hypothetical protein SLEP1_g3721 [Rubroshorea leprosula]